MFVCFGCETSGILASQTWTEATHTPCIGRQDLNHWNPGGAPGKPLDSGLFKRCIFCSKWAQFAPNGNSTFCLHIGRRLMVLGDSCDLLIMQTWHRMAGESKIGASGARRKLLSHQLLCLCARPSFGGLCFCMSSYAEAPIWPPDAKTWLTAKDPDAGKDWGQEEKGMTEDEMVGWHHWRHGREFEQALGVGDGQGGLACCSPCGHKEPQDPSLCRQPAEPRGWPPGGLSCWRAAWDRFWGSPVRSRALLSNRAFCNGRAVLDPCRANGSHRPQPLNPRNAASVVQELTSKILNQYMHAHRNETAASTSPNAQKLRGKSYVFR